MMRRSIGTPGVIGAIAVVLMALSFAPRVDALPMFARKYNLPCAKCHMMPPRLTIYGYSFYKAGFRLPTPTPPAHILSDVASFLTDIRLQNTNPNGDTGFDVNAAEIQLAVAVDPHLSSRLQYAFSSQTDAASGFGEAWGRYNSAAIGEYWTALAGQIPVLDGFKLAGVSNRDVTLTAPLIFGPNGPFSAPGQGDISLNGLERGAEIGYNHGNLNGRVSLLNGVNEAGAGDRSLTGQGRRLHDAVLQGEYLIGNAGTSVSGFYYHGQMPTHDVNGNAFNDAFNRAGAFGSYSRILKAGKPGIPAFSLDANAGYIWGDDKMDITGAGSKVSGGVGELDLYKQNRSALVLRYDQARPSDVAGTPTTRAYTAAIADRPSDFYRWELEYRNQASPGANSLIASFWFFY